LAPAKIQKNGEEMVAKMRAASPSKDAAQFHYLPVDITLMSDVKRFTREYMELNGGHLNTLLVTSGGLNVGSRQDTSEGVDHNFAICTLGRFLVINRLLPSLSRSPEGARVMSVLSAGLGGPIADLDDIEMKKPGAYSKYQSAKYNSIMNDFVVEGLTEQTKDKNISFFHLNPGAVATDILRNNKVFGASVITPLFTWFLTKPEDYAEVVAHIATAPEYGPERSGSGITAKGEFVPHNAYLSTPGVREKVWAYCATTSGLDKD